MGDPFGPAPRVSGHGPGGAWLVRMWPNMRGDADQIPEVRPAHDAVAEAARRWGRVALGASGTPYHELIPAVLGQRITAREAFTQWYRLVDRFGEPAPDPQGSLRLPPSPERLARVPYHELHTLGIEKKRADTLREVARCGEWLVSNWLDGSAREQKSASTGSLQRIHGVGVWTAAVAGGIAFGDPDALQVGDFHVKNTVAWALHRRARGTDDEMIASLATYAGQRHRVVRWLELDGWRAPMRGPRRRIVSIARL